MTPSQLFQRALHFHESGSLAQAEMEYRKVLAADPAHVDALVNVGVICLALGRLAESLQFLRNAAVSIPPTGWSI